MADFVTVMPGVRVAVTVAESVGGDRRTDRWRAEAVAVLAIVPASTSAWVTVYEAVQVVDAPGARVAAAQVTADRPGNGSATPTDVSVTLPALVTMNV